MHGAYRYISIKNINKSTYGVARADKNKYL